MLLELKDLREIKAPRVQQVPQEQMVRMVRLEPQVHKVCKGQRVHRDLKGIREIPVQRDLMVRMELLELRDLKVTQVPQE